MKWNGGTNGQWEYATGIFTTMLDLLTDLRR